MFINLIFYLAIVFFLSAAQTQAKTLYVIDIGYEVEVSLGEKIAVLSCQGLMNRNNNEEYEDEEDEIAIYTIKENWDQLWLDTALNQNPGWDVVPMAVDEYLNDICEKENFTKILYSKSIHHEVIPQIITLAG